MSDTSVLKEAAVVLSTFGLARDIPAFSSTERVRISEGLKTSKARITKLLEQRKSPILREDAGLLKMLDREIVKESVKYERYVVLEAAKELSVGEMAHQLDSMVSAMGPLAELSEGLAAVISAKAGAAKDAAVALEDLESAGMKKDFGSKLAEFKKLFADVGVMVRGLIALSDDMQSGKLAETLDPIMAWVMKRKKKATSLLETLMEYDSEVKKVGGAEGGGDICRAPAGALQISFGSALKGFLGGLTGGERHIGVGMSGAPR